MKVRIVRENKSARIDWLLHKYIKKNTNILRRFMKYTGREKNIIVLIIEWILLNRIWRNLAWNIEICSKKVQAVQKSKGNIKDADLQGFLLKLKIKVKLKLKGYYGKKKSPDSLWIGRTRKTRKDSLKIANAEANKTIIIFWKTEEITISTSNILEYESSLRIMSTMTCDWRKK